MAIDYKNVDFTGDYSHIYYGYSAKRIDKDTARVYFRHKWVYVKNSNNSYFTFWCAYGLAINSNDTSYSLKIGRDGGHDQISLANVIKISGYQQCGWYKHSRSTICEGDWNGISGGSESWIDMGPYDISVGQDDTSVRIDFALLRPSCGDNASAEDLKWFHAKSSVKATIDAYKPPVVVVPTHNSPILGAVTLVRSNLVMTATWMAVTKDKLATSLQYQVYTSTNDGAWEYATTTASTDYTYPLPSSIMLGGTTQVSVTPIDNNYVSGNTVYSNKYSHYYSFPYVSSVVLTRKRYDCTLTWSGGADEMATALSYSIQYRINGGAWITAGATTNTQYGLRFPDEIKFGGKLQFSVTPTADIDMTRL